MDAFKVAGIAAITAILALTVRSFRPELGGQVAAAGGMVLLLMILPETAGISEGLKKLAADYGLDGGVLGVAAKVVGIAYITQISADICRDANEPTLASRTELCGRLLMVSAAMPVITSLFGSISDMINEYL